MNAPRWLTVWRDQLRDRWYLLLPVALVVIGVVIPLVYLLIRAFQADPDELARLVLRMRNLELLWNTLTLTVGVLGGTAMLAFPLAWLTTRTDLPGRRWLTWLGVLPLAIPGYLMAYALLGATGSQGVLSEIIGVAPDRLSGYTGAWVALSLGTFPYLFLNLRTTLLDLDPALEESAQALGYPRWRIFWEVVLPQLRPAFLAGGLLVGLHVIGDFGVVSLMRFETFSYALYLQYTASYDRIYAAWLAIMLLILTIAILFLEARLLKGLLYHRTGTGARRQAAAVRLGPWRLPSYLFVGSVGLASVVLPVATIAYWMSTATQVGVPWSGLGSALWDSVSASAPAAVLAAMLALPVAYLGVRLPSRITSGLERIAYLGYATPPLAFALALIVFSLQIMPFAYQTLGLLIVAYALHFMAEAIGPIRSSLYQAPPNLEEAARSLGRTPLQAFVSVTLPLLKNGIVVSIAFVFLSAMKELPITFLISPMGFNTLAVRVWGYANEAMLATAAPYALAIMIFSGAFVGLLLVREKSKRNQTHAESMA